MSEATTPSVKMLAAAIAEVDAMTEAEAKAALVEQRTREFFSSRPRTASSKSGSHEIGAPRLTIGQAVLIVCKGKWLTPEEIVDAVGTARPGTNEASVYPEIMRAKKNGALAHKDGRYKTV